MTLNSGCNYSLGPQNRQAVCLQPGVFGPFIQFPLREEVCWMGRFSLFTSYGAENFGKHQNGDFRSWRVEPGIISHVLHVVAVFHPNCLQFFQLCSCG